VLAKPARKNVFGFAFSALLVGGALMAGCTGVLDSPLGPGEYLGPNGERLGPNGSALPSGGSAASPNGDGFVSGQIDALSCQGRELHPGSMPGLVRLTHRQYANVVSDLFGVQSNAATEFVSDQEFYGFDNNAAKLSVDSVQTTRYRAMAERVAQEATVNLATLARVAPCLSKDRTDACRDEFLRGLLKLMYRRPLSDGELTRYRALFAAGATLYEEGDAFTRGLRVVIEGALQSPLFVYRTELRDLPLDGKVVELDNYELAARLALTFWGSVPDLTLMNKAEAKKLALPSELETEVRRLLDDPRAGRVLDDFHAQWLEFGKLRFDKDATLFPGYDKASFEQAARSEALTFARNMTLAERGGIADLFSSSVTWVDGTLAKNYGLAPPASGIARVELDPAQRSGLFTQTAFLAGHADAVEGSPIHRGAYIQRRVLCREFGTLPPNVGTVPPPSAGASSTRERVALKTAAAGCQHCHKHINPTGFAFEAFDSLGRVRTQDHGVAVDASGTLELDPGSVASFSGAVAFADELAASDKAKRCYETQWFRFAYGRAEGNDDACLLSEIDEKAKAKDYNLKELLVALGTSRAFRFRAQEDL
jgi:hypothetical protein